MGDYLWSQNELVAHRRALDETPLQSKGAALSLFKRRPGVGHPAEVQQPVREHHDRGEEKDEDGTHEKLPPHAATNVRRHATIALGARGRGAAEAT